MFRIAFDPSLPVVAAQPFMARGQTFASGDAVDWRALGITEQMLYEWWLSHLVVHPLDAKAPMQQGEKRTFIVDGKPMEFTAGERVEVETPAQRLRRKRKQPDPASLTDDELERLTRPE